MSSVRIFRLDQSRQRVTVFQLRVAAAIREPWSFGSDTRPLAVPLCGS